MHALVVERVPAAAGRAFPEPFEIGVPRDGIEDVVLARRIVDVEPGLADELMRVVELLRLGEMRDVAGVQHEGGLLRHRLDLADRLFQRRARVGVGGLGEADVAVGDLHEGEAALLRLRLADQARGRHAAAHRPNDAAARPNHAFQDLPPVQLGSRLVHDRLRRRGRSAACGRRLSAARRLFPAGAIFCGVRREGEPDAVAAGALGLVQRRVGAGDQGIAVAQEISRDVAAHAGAHGDDAVLAAGMRNARVRERRGGSSPRHSRRPAIDVPGESTANSSPP